MQVSAFPAIFKADFGRFRRVSACSGRFPAWFGRIDRRPIRLDTARFWPNQPESARIEAPSARIEPHRRESEKKKKTDAVRRAGNRVGRGCGTSGAASVLSSFQLGPHKALVPMASLPSSIRNIGLLSKQISSKLSKPFFIQFLSSNLLTILTSHLSLKILSLMMLHILGPLVYVM